MKPTTKSASQLDLNPVSDFHHSVNWPLIEASRLFSRRLERQGRLVAIAQRPLEVDLIDDEIANIKQSELVRRYLIWLNYIA